MRADVQQPRKPVSLQVKRGILPPSNNVLGKLICRAMKQTLPPGRVKRMITVQTL
jgi:hypothetical protein